MLYSALIPIDLLYIILIFNSIIQILFSFQLSTNGSTHMVMSFYVDAP